MQVKTKNLVVGLLAVALVGLLWYRVVYSPMESKASKDKAAAHDAEVSAQNLKQAISGATASKKNAKKNDVATEVMLAAVPVDPAEASFLRSIDALRLASGADWQSVTPTAPTISGTVATINIGITVQGTEDQLARYLSGLSDLKRIFVTDNVSITSAPSGAPGTVASAPDGAVFSGGDLQMQIAGRIFTQPGAVASASTASSGAATGQTPAPSAPAGAGGSSPPGVQNN